MAPWKTRAPRRVPGCEERRARKNGHYQGPHGTEGPLTHSPAMPRYFFHLQNDEWVEDREGLELPGPEAAADQALEEARAMVCASIKNGELNLDHYIEVADTTGETLFRLTYREAFEIKGER